MVSGITLYFLDAIMPQILYVEFWVREVRKNLFFPKSKKLNFAYSSLTILESRIWWFRYLDSISIDKTWREKQRKYWLTHEKREDGWPFSGPLIIHDTTRCLYKVPLSLTVLIPLSSKMTKVKLNPERRILNGKIRGQICLNHHLLLIRKSMAFDARVHVCLWS